MKKKTLAAIVAAVMLLSGCNENSDNTSDNQSSRQSSTTNTPNSGGTSSSEEDKYANAPAPVIASMTMPEDYSTEAVEFKTEIDDFNAQVKVMTVDHPDAYNYYTGKGYSVRQLEIDGIPLYEVKKNDGTVKPLVIQMHGGGGRKNLDEAGSMAVAEDVCVVSIDCAGSGDSQDGPIQAPAAFMETVKDIDTLIEYYNTVSDVDATNFGLMGHSMGGNISAYYVIYGKYKPTAINLMNSSADLTEEGPIWDCFDKGQNGQTPIWTEEQLKSFASATKPMDHPEYFEDIWVYACCGEQDDTHSPVNMKKFCDAIEALGSDKVVYHLYEGVGHEIPQDWLDNEQKEFFSKLKG